MIGFTFCGTSGERRITVREAAQLLRITRRQVFRLLKAYQTGGPAALVSRRRGAQQPLLPERRAERGSGADHEHYADFGPTLAGEKLAERHGLDLGVETIRRWMIADGLWTDRRQRLRRVHQPRHRRDCVGELVQIDGSEHCWFEDRGPPARCWSTLTMPPAG